MKTVYTIVDPLGREMLAEVEDGHIKVIMEFIVDKDLTVEEVFETLDWIITDKRVYEDPKILPFKRKED